LADLDDASKETNRVGFWGIVAALAIVLMLSASTATAQYTSGIAGTVTDQTGAVVQGATVTLFNPATGETKTVETSASGYYDFPALSTAIYSITVTAPGFEKLEQKNLKTEVAMISTVNLKLQVGAQNAQVTVTDAPPPVDLAGASVSGTIEEQEVQELPLTSRNFYSLVVLTPGVTGLPTGGSGAYAQSAGDIFAIENGVNLNAGGMRTESNSFLIDSAPVNSGPRVGVVNINPNAESVQELRVSVNNFTAVYGGNAGATVNVITRGGSNQFHGSADEFFHNNDLDACGGFCGGKSVAPYNHNEFGGSVGGPIYKDHTFFFFSLDALRESFPSTYLTNAYTPDFISYLKSNFPNNISTQILSSYPSSISTNLNQETVGSLMGSSCTGSTPVSTPLGNLPCSLNVLGYGNFSTSAPRNGLQWNARIDQTFRGGLDRIYANFFRTSLTTENAQVYSAFSVSSPAHTFYGNVSEVHTFSASLLNDLRYSYTRVYGIDDCAHCNIPNIGVGGLGPQFGNFGPFPFVQNNYSLSDSLTWIRGAHTFTFGGGTQWDGSNANGLQAFQRPYFGFNDPLSFAADQPDYEGNLAADLKTGKITGSIYNDRRQFFDFFAQDDWKIRPNLTLNLGLRYESFGNFKEANPDTTNIQFHGGSTLEQEIANASVNIVPRVLNHNLDNNWGPRIGFAWDPWRNGKTSVRGGFGISYDVPSDQIYPPGPSNPPVIAFASLSNQTPPYVPVYCLGKSATAPYDFCTPTVQTGLDAKNGPIFEKAGLSVMDPNMKTESTYNYSLGVQTALGSGWVAEVDYMGAQARHQYGQTDLNRFAGDLIQNKGTLTRLNSSFGSIEYTQANLNASYNGMTAALRSMDWHHLTTQIAYTMGKSLDYASNSGGGLNLTNAYDPKADRGPADFDVHNRLSLSLLYELPGAKLSNALLRSVVGGWEIGDIMILQQGTPFSVYCSRQFQFGTNADGSTDYNTNVGCDYNADGWNYDRPNVPGADLHIAGASRKQFVNGLFDCTTSLCGNVFAAPALGQEGSLSRNTYRNPGFDASNISLLKNVKVNIKGLHETTFQFRTEATNVFNRGNLTGVNGDLNAGNGFGKSTAEYTPRRLQIGGRLVF